MGDEVQFVANKLAAQDMARFGRVEEEDFYLSMAEVAIRATWEFDTRPRGKRDYIEGFVVLGANE